MWWLTDVLFAYAVAAMSEVSLDRFQEEDFLMHCMYFLLNETVVDYVLAGLRGMGRQYVRIAIKRV